MFLRSGPEDGQQMIENGSPNYKLQLKYILNVVLDDCFYI